MYEKIEPAANQISNLNLLCLLEKINLLADINSRKIFLKLYESNDFNIMFRQTSIKPESLGIADFLYLHRDEFKVDVNAKGPSKKGALDFAIEKNSKPNTLFLLKLKEIEVNDLVRERIKDKFGQDFRTVNIAPHYLSLGDKLIKMNSSVKKLTDDYSRKLSTLTEDLKIKILHVNKQIKSLNSVSGDERAQIHQTILNDMHRFVEQYLIELNKLSPEYDDFEETFNQYLPYSYAQEKILQGNEFAKNQLNSSMKNTCLHNRTGLEETAKAVRHNKMALINNFDEVMSLFVLVLVLFKESSFPSITLHSEEDKDPEQSTQVHEINKPLVSQPSQEKHTSPKPSSQNTLSNTNNSSSKKTANQSNIKASSNAKSKIETVSDASDSKLDRLKELHEELTQLKQKGQVKLTTFQSILKKISNEMALQIKPTKKGFMVKSTNPNPFSFHTPHKDKGVDKATIESMKDLIEKEINTVNNSSLK